MTSPLLLHVPEGAVLNITNSHFTNSVMTFKYGIYLST